MRLFLSSYKFGDHAKELVELVGSNKRVAIITNASDYHSESEITQRVQAEILAFEKLGLSAKRLDLKNYFSQNIMPVDLANFGLVWANGGNSFVLRRAIVQSGLEGALFPLLGDDKLVYGGYSAGACVATPTLHGIDLCDDPNLVPTGYDEEVIWDGMDMVPFAIAPHYKSNHPESAAMDDVVDYYQTTHIPYEALTDGQVIVCDGNKLQKLS